LFAKVEELLLTKKLFATSKRSTNRQKKHFELGLYIKAIGYKLSHPEKGLHKKINLRALKKAVNKYPRT